MFSKLSAILLIIGFLFVVGSANAQDPSSPVHFFIGYYEAQDRAEGRGIGGEIDVSYNFNRYAITSDFRLGVGVSDNFWLYYSGSLGGRYFFREFFPDGSIFFRDGGLTPYVGAGLSVMNLKQTLEFSWEGNDFISETEERIGIGIFGSIGIETTRQSKNRFRVELRIDKPFFSEEAISDEGFIFPNLVPVTFLLGYTRTFP